MPALLEHELPGVDTPERAVANDRRTVSTADAIGHGRVRIGSTTAVIETGRVRLAFRPVQRRLFAVPSEVCGARWREAVPDHDGGGAA